MNHRRYFEQDHDARQRRAREERQAFSERLHRGSHHDGPGWPTDRDLDWREEPYAGRASADRFGGYSDTGYGGTYEPRGQSDWSRASVWDEDRFGYPEGEEHGTGRGGGAEDSPRGRFAEDAPFPGGRGARHARGGSGYGSPVRHFDPMRDPGPGRSGGAAAFDRSPPPRGGGVYGGYGIPSGSELGGYGMDDSARGGEQNWSGSNWGSQPGWRSEAPRGPRWRGRTPKGYVRSDERIKDDVCERLCHSSDIDVSEVSVEARNGTIVLEGSVPDRRMKHRIEDICEECIGVNDVDNRIRIARDRADASREADAGTDTRMGSKGSVTGERPGVGSAGTVPPRSAH